MDIVQITCGIHSERNIRMILKHIRLIHADEPHFSVDCTLQGCQRKFRNFHTYRNHIYFFHNNYEGEDITADQREESGDERSNAEDDDAADISTEVETYSRDTPGDFEIAAPHNLTKAAATWILKVREQHLLPQSTIEGIIKDIDTLYEVSIYS